MQKEALLCHLLTSMWAIRETLNLFLNLNRTLPLGGYKIPEIRKEELRTFLSETKIPLEPRFLDLAFNEYELSYSIRNLALMFLSSMLCLEVLYNAGNDPPGMIARRLALRCSSILGRTRLQRTEIEAQVLELYRLRSYVLHEGLAEQVKGSDIERARRLVRESIKTIHQMGLTKVDVIRRAMKLQK